VSDDAIGLHGREGTCDVTLLCGVVLSHHRSDEPEATLYIGNVPNYAQELKTKQKNVVFLGESFLYGFFGKPTAFDVKLLQPILYVTSLT